MELELYTKELQDYKYMENIKAKILKHQFYDKISSLPAHNQNLSFTPLEVIVPRNLCAAFCFVGGFVVLNITEAFTIKSGMLRTSKKHSRLVKQDKPKMSYSKPMPD